MSTPMTIDEEFDYSIDRLQKLKKIVQKTLENSNKWVLLVY